MRVRAQSEADGEPVTSLLTARAVRERAHWMLALAEAGRLEHFTIDGAALDRAADYVANTTRASFPRGGIPIHSRWRHFEIGGRDRWSELSGARGDHQHELARRGIDLVVTSVLLDAGAGPQWRWREPDTGVVYARSEGLALASLAAFRQGLFSSLPDDPLRADAAGLAGLSLARLAAAFQVDAGNPLIGLDGRLGLLRRLGAVVAQRTDVFGVEEHLGRLFDHLCAKKIARSSDIPAEQVLHTLLTVLGPIWTGRLAVDDVPLGDTWRHPALDVAGPTRGLVPLHKLSQWLAYSLIEPLEMGGLNVDGWDALTGLAEYRNGGLFLDLGVIVPRRADLLERALAPGDEPVVEWRALTVALLDKLAPLVRARLGLNERDLPLAAILEGGTWAAGRRIARERRAGGAPPITVVSDGSVF